MKRRENKREIVASLIEHNRESSWKVPSSISQVQSRSRKLTKKLFSPEESSWTTLSSHQTFTPCVKLSNLRATDFGTKISDVDILQKVVRREVLLSEIQILIQQKFLSSKSDDSDCEDIVTLLLKILTCGCQVSHLLH